MVRYNQVAIVRDLSQLTSGRQCRPWQPASGWQRLPYLPPKRLASNLRSVLLLLKRAGQISKRGRQADARTRLRLTGSALAELTRGTVPRKRRVWWIGRFLQVGVSPWGGLHASSFTGKWFSTVCTYLQIYVYVYLAERYIFVTHTPSSTPASMPHLPTSSMAASPPSARTPLP